MLRRLIQPLTRQPWWPRPGNGFDIEALLDEADASAPLVERHIWLIRVLDWVRRGEPVSGTQYVVRLLEGQPERRARVVALLGAFWRETDVAALLADYGFSPRSAFLNELGERVRRRLLPASPETHDLSVLFNLLFSHADDGLWLARLDDATLQGIGRLWEDALAAPPEASEAGALGWRDPFFDAMLYLGTQVRATGFTPAFRSRMGISLGQDFDAPEPNRAELSSEASARNAYRQLTHVIEQLRDQAEAHLRAAPQSPWPASLLHDAQYLRALLDTCAQAASGLHGHLDTQGISVNLVFQIDQLCERCRRIELLLEAVLTPQPLPALHRLVVTLVDVGVRRRSVRALFSQHTSQLARRVAERSAETGEHYITRSRTEYRDMLRRALGGGAVIAGTTFLKFAITAIGLTAFWGGFWAGVNYAASFVLVMLLHWTVATKQPAMTAPAMAASLPRGVSASDAEIEGFVDRVAQLIRSQAAAIAGNLAMCFPLVLAVQLIAKAVFGETPIGDKDARYVLDSLTLLGPTALFAAFTGVLLFASSLVAGWAENWFVLHRLDSAIAWNPRIVARLGTARAQRWARWWRANISGLAANISLGLMLGLVPAMLGFFGVPIDVRHVTLASGQLGAALGALGWGILAQGAFWWCVAGIAVTGVLNLTVSFTLAFRVALRSRGVRLQDRRRIGTALWRRLRMQPMSFFRPPPDTGAPAGPAGH